MANNQYKNKVVYGNDTLMDITDTTATTDEVVAGEVFYAANGQRSVGTLGVATTSSNGLMSSTDKAKLDEFSAASNYLTSHLDISGKADKTDTVLNTSLSRGRIGSTGTGSIAFGNNVKATANYGVALGIGTEAAGKVLIVAGKYNIADTELELWGDDIDYNVGDIVIRNNVVYICKELHTSGSTFNSSYWDVSALYANVNTKYASIIGNGSDSSHLSNAAALDWAGNLYIMGNLYVGAHDDSTQGSKVATEAYVIANAVTPSALANKVDKVTGKGLSTNDFTDAYKTKLDNALTSHQDISYKVDKVTGKGLSTNDFTDAYKTKLDNALTSHQDISYKANSADLATVATSGSYNDLLNKPTIPSKTSDLTNDSGFLTQHLDITGKISTSAKGAANGVAELDSNGKVPSSLLPSYVDDVLEYSSRSGFPGTGETGKIYIDTTTNITYRWSGSTYVPIGSDLALGETSSTAYRGDYGAAAYTHAVTNKGSAFASGLYKITTNSEGHVTSATAVVKTDITGLGIPGSDTTYSNATTDAAGLMSAADKTKLDSLETFNCHEYTINIATTDWSNNTYTWTNSAVTISCYIAIAYGSNIRNVFMGDLSYSKVNGGIEFTVSETPTGQITIIATIIDGISVSNASSGSLILVLADWTESDSNSAAYILHKPDLSLYLTSVPTLVGATSLAAGTAGLVPAPTTSDTAKFLRGDGTWATIGGSFTQVLSNWNESDTSSPAYIANKPNLSIYLTLHQDISGKVNSADLATVATSGNYTDLLNKPDLSQYLTSVPTLIGASSSAAGTAGLVPVPSAGDEEKFLRGDGTWASVPNAYVLPAATTSILGGIKVGTGLSIDANGVLSANTLTGATSSTAGTAGLAPAPAAGDENKFLKADGTWAAGGLPMVILSYGNSTWDSFINAYKNNVIVYCRASSNSNPATGAQGRMAFMAYVNNGDDPTEVEFQYYRSVSSHTASLMGDQVFVYKLNKTSGWSVTTREASLKLIVNNTSTITVTWSSNKITLADA